MRPPFADKPMYLSSTDLTFGGRFGHWLDTGRPSPLWTTCLGNAARTHARSDRAHRKPKTCAVLVGRRC